VVTPAALSSINGAGEFQALSLASLNVPLTAPSLYVRLTVAAGSAATANIDIYGIALA